MATSTVFTKSPFFRFLSRQVKVRNTPCCLCAEEMGGCVGKVNYFGLANYEMIQCPDCGLISIDPIPPSEIVRQGCSKLYQSQINSQTPEEIQRGFSKSLRRGALFARNYLGHLKSHKSLSLLEVGPGDGYFSRGIFAELPQTKITFLDIVDDLIGFYQEHHPCEALTGELSLEKFKGRTFDVIVFRDLLEHTRDPVDFLKTARSLINPEGIIFFITPNGREDFWTIHQKYLQSDNSALMLLNHFHYFLPETLEEMLRRTGFIAVKAFKFGMKQHKQGLGHKSLVQFQEDSIPSVKEGDEPKIADYWKHNPLKVSSGLLNDLKFFSKIYSKIVDEEKEVTDFHDPKGHEFYFVGRPASK